MYTHGRKTLYSSIKEEELNRETIGNILTDLLEYHNRNHVESKYLKDYYIGIQDIEYKTKQTREEINNKMTENWAYCITEFMKSFILNEPIQYVQSTEGVSDEIVELNKFMSYENKAFKDTDLIEDIVLTGRGFRYVAPDAPLDEDEAPFEAENIEPENCEVVYYSGVGHKQLFAFVETKMVKEVMEKLTDLEEEHSVWKEYSEYIVYTKNKAYRYTTENGNVEFVSEEGIYPAGHRIIEYYFNKSRLSLIEVAKPILDKINQLESLDMDDMEQFVNALMVFKNANITEETIQQGRELGAILLKSDTNMPADVALLQGRMKATDTQVFYQRLLNALLAIVAMPFANDNGTYGDTGVARMAGQGWTMADQRANPLIASLIRSEKEVLKYVLRICKEKGGSIKNLKASDIEIRFRINKNANILEKTQALMNMKQAQIAPSVAIPTCKLFNDDQNAIKQSEQYYGADSFWKMPELNANSNQEVEEQNNKIQDTKETDKQKGI